MLFKSCGGLTVFTSTATMLRSVSVRIRSMPSRAVSPPQVGEATPGERPSSETGSLELQIVRRCDRGWRD